MESGSLLSDTYSFGEEYELPDSLLVIDPDEDAPYCLDSSNIDSNGELPIVCYELNAGHTTVIASNFDDWLFKFFFYNKR